MANLLIIGCGDIGLHTASRLIKKKHQVVGLRRNPPASTGLISDIQWIRADLAQPETLASIEDQFDYILYMPAPKRSPHQSLQLAYKTIFLDGLQHTLTKVAQFQRLKRFIFISSVSVYGHNQGQWVDENTPPAPKRFNGEILLEAENLIAQANLPATTVRFAGIYGPNRHRLINKVHQGCPVQNAPPKYTNRIHSQDCAGLLHFLIEEDLQGRDLAPLYVGVDNHPCAEQEINHWIHQQLQRGGLSPKPMALVPNNNSQNKRCSNKAIKALGYQFIYDSYQQGYLDITREYIAKERKEGASHTPNTSIYPKLS